MEKGSLRCVALIKMAFSEGSRFSLRRETQWKGLHVCLPCFTAKQSWKEKCVYQDFLRTFAFEERLPRGDTWPSKESLFHAEEVLRGELARGFLLQTLI